MSRSRRPRLPPQQTARRVLDVAVEAVNETGLTVSLEHLSFEDAIRRADVSRTAAYRLWPRKELFLHDLVRELARADAPMAVARSASLLHVPALLRPELARLADPAQRWAVVADLIRRGTELDFQQMFDSTAWRTYLALSATFLSLEDGTLRSEVQAGLAAAQQRLVDRQAESWERLASLLGFRLRPELGAGFDTLAALLAASTRGVIIMALSDPGLASRRVQADPFGTGVASWSLVSLSYAMIATGLLEPDPDAVWDAARAEAFVTEYEDEG